MAKLCCVVCIGLCFYSVRSLYSRPYTHIYWGKNTISKMLMYIIAIAVIIAGYVLMKWRNKQTTAYEALANYVIDKNWCLKEKADFDQSVTSFKVSISQEDIEYLNQRLDITRFATPSLSTSKFLYGVRDDYLKNFVAHWRTEYKWREQEKMLNEFKHFKTNIEGLNIHFLHETPLIASPNDEAKVILLIHGWPGSFVEYLEVIKHFIDPKKYSGNETDAFAVVCPSIPGYGFSDAPEKEGFNGFECARIFHKLMFRLGYKSYYIAGGDWGAFICNAMAVMYPSFVKGCYTTMGLSGPANFTTLQGIFSFIFPSLFFTRPEIEKVFPLKKLFGMVLQETGYFHLQATKPDTVGYALSDSPVGLAAYILEKFSTWTDKKATNSNTGLLNKYWTYDQLLNNIMIYWWSGSITSSMRFYKENMAPELRKLSALKIHVPCGFGWFPEEFIVTSKFWLKSRMSNLVHMTYMEAGGHFNAFQIPDAFVKDVCLFVRKVKEYELERIFLEKREAEEIRSSHLDRLEMK